MAAITAVGAYAPRFITTAEEFAEAWGHFQASGISEKAVPSADEDALTMAYEAATRAIEASDFDAAEVDWLGFASSRPPAAEEDLTAARLVRCSVFPRLRRDKPSRAVRAPGRELSGPGWMRSRLRPARPSSLPPTPRTVIRTTRSITLLAPEPRRSFSRRMDPLSSLTVRSTPRRIQARDSATLARTRRRDSASRSTTGRRSPKRSAAPSPGSKSSPDRRQQPSRHRTGNCPAAPRAAGVGTDEIQAAATVHELGDLGAASVPVSLAGALTDGYESILAVSHGSGAGADALLVTVSGDVPAKIAIESDDAISVRRLPAPAGHRYVGAAVGRWRVRQRPILAALAPRNGIGSRRVAVPSVVRSRSRRRVRVTTAARSPPSTIP